MLIGQAAEKAILKRSENCRKCISLAMESAEIIGPL